MWMNWIENTAFILVVAVVLFGGVTVTYKVVRWVMRSWDEDVD